MATKAGENLVGSAWIGLLGAMVSPVGSSAEMTWARADVLLGTFAKDNAAP